MVIVDQAPSLKVYDFKEEAVLCDIPLGNLENYYIQSYSRNTRLIQYFSGHTEFLVGLIFNQG